MLGLPRDTRPALSSWRRSAAAALIALQAVIAVSPVLERRDAVPRDAQVETQGSRHLFAHDESSCAVCAVRTLEADVPPQAAAPIAVATNSLVDPTDAADVRLLEPAPGNHSRAPPDEG